MTEIRYGAGLRDRWSLESGMRFLNHGSFGATPIAVQQVQEDWRRRMERQPVRFMRELGPRLRAAAARLAAFVGADADGLVFVENATQGANAVLRSLRFRPGDRIVATDHIYNAVRTTLAHLAERAGIVVDTVALGLPVASAEAVVAAVDAALAAAPTRLLVIDHVASASALVLPAAELVARAHARGVPVLVDGAHAPGMLDLDVGALGADWYVGNCHKWLCAPKGAGFLHAAPHARADLHPTTVSHGYLDGLAAEFDWIGTRDPSSWLSVPAAIDFHEELGGAALRARNHGLATAAAAALAAELGTETGAPAGLFGSMATVRLPTDGDPGRVGPIGDALWQRHRIEVPVMPLAGRLWLRLSAAAYTDPQDFSGLAEAVRDVLALSDCPSAR